MRRLEAFGFVLVVLVTLVTFAGAGALGGTAGAGAAAEAPSTGVNQAEFRITVYENASAEWTLTYTQFFEDDEEREQFESEAREFNENESELYRNFQEQGEALTAAGAEATDRDMEATEFSRQASLGGDCPFQDCGTVRMSFVWTEFAAERNDELVVGDVFETGLPIGPDQQLVFEAGPELRFESAAPEDYRPSATTIEESSSITYEGDRVFPDNHPRVVFLSADTPVEGTETVTPSPTEAGGSEDDQLRAGDLAAMALAVVFLLALGVGFAFVWRHGRDSMEALGLRGEEATDPADSEQLPDGTKVEEPELLSDEDRVLALLQQNGGRMKQVDIVEETEWSKSKVSMLLSEMEDEGQISKLRVGRENIVSLAGHEPEAAGSPHDDE